jgi:hypothetical protein
VGEAGRIRGSVLCGLSSGNVLQSSRERPDRYLLGPAPTSTTLGAGTSAPVGPKVTAPPVLSPTFRRYAGGGRTPASAGTFASGDAGRVGEA